MGLADLTPDTSNSEYKRYPAHEWDDKLYDWFDEMRSKFPGGVEVDFIEVSTEMEKTNGFAYFRGENGYIRIREGAIEAYPEWHIKHILLHEMTHLWFYQNNMKEISDGDPIFEWALGRVGADVSGISLDSREYQVIHSFLEHDKEQ